jgi:PAS domain S-box-containing protein
MPNVVAERVQPVAAAHILVVEDVGQEASATEEQLRALGYAVSAIVGSADEAHQVASTRCPDLVLMDIRIAGALDGIDAALMLQQTFGVPVVFVTGYADDKTLDRAKRAGPVGYLVKPYTRSDLRVAIELGLHTHALSTKLREREHWFSTTLRSIGDGVLAVDALGLITFVNAAAEAMLGAKSAALTGRALNDVVHFRADATGEAVPSPVTLALRTGRIARLPRGTSLVTADERARPIDDTATPILSETGSTLGAVLIFKDVTERLRLEAQLADAARLAAVGTLAAGVAHEINNPLAAVLGNVSYALTSLGDICAQQPALSGLLDDVVAALRDATTGTERAATIVVELRESVRPTPGELRGVNVAEVAALAFRLMGSEVDGRARRVLRVPEDLFVMADELRLSQVLVNLLANAVHATPEGAVANEISIEAHAAGERVVIRVGDSGVGMSPDLQHRVFEPFFSTKEPGVGMGLGLSLVHGFVTSFGGTIALRSELGRGTTFEISLPAAPAESAAPPGDTLTQPARRARVLVIDDEPMLLRSTKRMLGARHDVTTAAGGEQGIELILGADPPFDVVVCDVTMPEVGGRAVRDRLMAIGSAMLPRLVFTSGGATNPDSEALLQEVPWLAKPFTSEQLESRIAAVLAVLDRS